MGINLFLLDSEISRCAYLQTLENQVIENFINLLCITGHSTCFMACVTSFESIYNIYGVCRICISLYYGTKYHCRLKVHKVQTCCINTAETNGVTHNLNCDAYHVSGVHAASIFRVQEQAKQSCVHSPSPILPPFLSNSTFTLCLSSILKMEFLQITSTRCHHPTTA
jgi:hypothetical protein